MNCPWNKLSHLLGNGVRPPNLFSEEEAEMTKVLVLYYSSYGHIETMADAIADGARGVPGTDVTVKRVPELVPEDVAEHSGMKTDQAAPIAEPGELADYDAIIFGTPPRFGNMAAQMRNFLDRTGGLWPNTDFATVGENGCENCHIPHTAGSGQRLLIFSFEEDNCLVCHDGRIASTDIASAMAKPYYHGVQEFTGIHDAAENYAIARVPRHVECADCHNAHQANDLPSPGGGVVSGAIQGVTGVAATGQTVPWARYEYEICFKCHGDIANNVINTPPVTRQIIQLDTQMAFNPANPSYHPVVSQGRNPDVPSLLPPLSTASTIGCGDCHGNSDPLGPAGPHGSDYPYLLVDRYVTDDNTMASPSSYALCYRCHDRAMLLQDVSFEHRLHVVDEKSPCSACHDPHGISAMQGDALRNSHLINFDLAIVSPTAAGRLEYNDRGRFRGRCFLNCHGKLHDPIDYPK